MRLPIGVQDFAKLREGNYIYVDKTMYLTELLQGGTFFFARPRRFGKSLLLSIMKYAFEGRKDLFTGLWLEKNYDFKPHPVIRIDFSLLDFEDRSLKESLVESFIQTAEEYQLTIKSKTPKSAFEELIRKLSKIGKVVVLIDEYDKPITDNLFDAKKRNLHTEVLKTVYGILKPLDGFLHQVVITGVSKIGKLSLFSDLNNIQDISLNPKFATLCGYTKNEIEHHFPDYLESLSKYFKKPLKELWDDIRFWYNGYSWDGINKVYCPYSFLLFLEQQRFKSFWFETGTPTFLMQLIRQAKLNPLEFDHLEVSDSVIVATDVERIDPIGLMFQTGYLTIQSIEDNPRGTLYGLSYPNEEVHQAFSSGLLLEYGNLLPFQADQLGLELQRALLRLDWDAFFSTVNRVLAGIPYEIFPEQESYAHSLVHLMLVSTGLQVQSQVQTSTGRIDTIIETPDQFVILEFKIGGKSETALKQIVLKDYAAGFSSKTVIGIGVVFNLKKKMITDWKAQTLA
jgi:hypothetical protein